MKHIVLRHQSGEHVGICSVCSAHPLVIEAALRFDLTSQRQVLIEATSNQVNQYGGYTGMTPANFRDFVYRIADQLGFPRQRILLGGDHLGPNCWQNENAVQAMEKSLALIQSYVTAGFSKIHLDASMPCADDTQPLDPSVIAQRAALMCQIAEHSASKQQKQTLTYVIGTEVPVPGGEAATIDAVHVTRKEDAAQTLSIHRDAFHALGLDEAFSRVIALVVQPGVEFDHGQVIPYKPDAAEPLASWVTATPVIFEAHSTDYQTKENFRLLVRDHFAILKVGPALTFALREAIFALAYMENLLIPPEKRSNLFEVINEVMFNEPQYWKKYYRTDWRDVQVDMYFSLSDRIRYYWPHKRIQHSVDKLIHNLGEVTLPLGMLSQYLPAQFKRIMHNELTATPKQLIIDKIQDVLRDYRYGCSLQNQ